MCQKIVSLYRLIQIEQDDLLPKYICGKCLVNLNTAYHFKMQCESTDREFRKSILTGLQKYPALKIAIRNRTSDSDKSDSDDALSESSVGSSVGTTFNDLESYLSNYNKYKSDGVQSESEISLFTKTKFKYDANDEQSNQIVDENAMDISPKVSRSFEQAIECVDEEMCSVKSDKESLPPIVNHQLDRHAKGHGVFRYQCSVCTRWFEKRHQLNLHHKSHITCSLCERKFTNQIHLNRHIRIDHKQVGNRHTCSTCERTFDQLASLRLHQSVHQAERRFGCDICKQTFKSEVDLKLHKNRHLPTEYRLKRKHSSPKKTYRSPPKLCVCNECGKRFLTIAMLRIHKQ